jgi:hypothetical protein
MPALGFNKKCSPICDLQGTYETALTVGESLNLKAILDKVLEKVIAFMGVDAGVIDAGDCLRLLSAARTSPLSSHPSCSRHSLLIADD